MSTKTHTSPEPAGGSTRSTVAPAATRSAPTAEAVAEGVESPAQSLDSSVRATMEQRFGHNFSDIRVHAGPTAADSARALGADAFTAGRDLVFGAGRYNPASREGQRLLAHELMHAVRARRANGRRGGIAPEDAPAEREADRAADRVIAGDQPKSVFDQCVSPGTPWGVHRQVTKTSTKGKVEHAGEVGHLPGQIGVGYGTVEVRTGEEIEFKAGAKFPNVIALEYSGLLSGDMKWLQFVWFEMWANTPKGSVYSSATVPTTSGTKPFTNNPKSPNWSVDSASTSDPFYEAGFANLRTRSATTVFDAPGGGSFAPSADALFKAVPTATSVTFTAHFETFLIRTDGAVYVVGWQASTAFTQVKGTTTAAAIGYTVGTSGPVSGLPADRQKLLATSYPKFKTIK